MDKKIRPWWLYVDLTFAIHGNLKLMCPYKIVGMITGLDYMEKDVFSEKILWFVVGCSSWKCVKGSCCIAPRISKDRAGINGIRKLVFIVNVN